MPSGSPAVLHFCMVWSSLHVKSSFHTDQPHPLARSVCTAEEDCLTSSLMVPTAVAVAQCMLLCWVHDKAQLFKSCSELVWLQALLMSWDTGQCECVSRGTKRHGGRVPFKAHAAQAQGVQRRMCTLGKRSLEKRPQGMKNSSLLASWRFSRAFELLSAEGHALA